MHWRFANRCSSTGHGTGVVDRLQRLDECGMCRPRPMARCGPQSMTSAEASAVRAAATRWASRFALAAASAVGSCTAAAALSSEMRASSTISDRKTGASIAARRRYACTSAVPSRGRPRPAGIGRHVAITRTPGRCDDDGDRFSEQTPPDARCASASLSPPVNCRSATCSRGYELSERRILPG